MRRFTEFQIQALSSFLLECAPLTEKISIYIDGGPTEFDIVLEYKGYTLCIDVDQILFWGNGEDLRFEKYAFSDGNVLIADAMNRVRFFIKKQ